LNRVDIILGDIKLNWFLNTVELIYVEKPNLIVVKTSGSRDGIWIVGTLFAYIVRIGVYRPVG